MDETLIQIPTSYLVRDYLVEASHVIPYTADTDWACAVEAEPRKPFNAVTVFTENPVRADRTVSGLWERPVVSIRVRSKDHRPGYHRARLIQGSMDDLSRWTWNGGGTFGSEFEQIVVVSYAYRTRGIMSLGKDENSRWVFNMEYALAIESIT